MVTQGWTRPPSPRQQWLCEWGPESQRDERKRRPRPRGPLRALGLRMHVGERVALQAHVLLSPQTRGAGVNH